MEFDEKWLAFIFKQILIIIDMMSDANIIPNRLRPYHIQF